MMHQKLIKIIEVKQREVEELKRSKPDFRDDDPPPIRDFKGSISIPDRISLIAEIKFASPSAGPIREKTDPLRIGLMYQNAGASAVSLLTDKKFFQGDLENLPELKKNISLPILRKDFIIDEIQVKESFYYGADAILLIARILPMEQLKDLITLCRDLGLFPLTEVHDIEDLEKALECGADIIGINNRDLDNFEVDVDTTMKLAPHVPEDCIIVSESGLENIEDIQALKNLPVRAVLVGSALMRSANPEEKAREMVKAGTR